MSHRKRARTLLPILLLTWFLAILLGGGLITASSMGAFVVPTALSANAGQPANTSLPALPPTWTSSPPETEPALKAAPTSTRDSSAFSPYEPTFTPANPFPATPTFIITPILFSEGPIVIGTSAGGRPIEVYRFGTGAVHRMIVAGIHGGYEWNTTALADELIAYFQENPDQVPRAVTLYIVRTLNPDGYARVFGTDGRVNDNGVDLNRNFPVNWAADWNRSRCWNFARTTGGPTPGSETETRALIEFITQRTRVTALISYHSAALGIFPGGDPPHPASTDLAEAIAAVSTYPYPPVDIGCLYTGTLADWAASEGIAAVDMELHTHALTDFDENLNIVQLFLAWRRK